MIADNNMRRKCLFFDLSRRCSVRIRVSVVILSTFISIHLLYMHNVNELHEKDLDIALYDSLRPLADKKKFSLPTKESNESIKPLHDGEEMRSVTCLHKRNVVFLKTHKTGSTTMNNILLRYAEKHELVVGLPPFRKWELAGYPAFFDKNLIDPRLDWYNLLCHHFRFDKKSVSQVMPDNTVYVTILRDPAVAFESGFSFFRDGPFSTWVPNYDDANALETFLNNPDKYYNRSTPWYFRAKNYQAFDLGFDHEKENEGYMEYVIQSMDSWFNLVMITERFEESLILLKDLLCMDNLSDLLHLRLKVRQNSRRRKADEKMQDQMRRWNAIDTRMYNYFLNVFDKKVELYGRERMKKEVEELDKMVTGIEKRCVLEYDHFDLRPWISRIRLNKDADELCNKLSWGEVQFGDYIRKKQLSYAKVNSERQVSQRDLISQLETVQRKLNVL